MYGRQIKLPSGDVVMVDYARGPQRCYACHLPASSLCDYPVVGRRKKSKTCDRPCCEGHSMKQDGEVDYCLEHWQERWD